MSLKMDVVALEKRSNMTGDVNTPTSTPENATQQLEILLIN